MTWTQSSAIDDNDIQGLLRFGHGHLQWACWYVLRVRDAEAARAWLRSVPVTSAVRREPRPDCAVQVALTAPGMSAIGVPESVVASFSPEFVAGMAANGSRARRLGDIGSNDPTAWRWGAGTRVPHLLVMLFATAERAAEWEREITGREWNLAFENLARLQAANLDGHEPFGFADGISQPDVDWAQQRAVRTEEPEYTNVAAVGEFVLGYRNEYGEFTDRPLLERDSRLDLPAAIEAPDKADLGRNGTYLVFRDLQQDVRGFWQYVYAQARPDVAVHSVAGAVLASSAGGASVLADGGLSIPRAALPPEIPGFSRSPDAPPSSAIEAQRIASAMVGRTMSGEPLARSEGAAKADLRISKHPRLNQFGFDQDPHGHGCPLGAHVRRANPRTGDFSGHVHGPISRLIHRFGFAPRGAAGDRIASTRFHRILRRGRKYGPTLTPDSALAPPPPDDPERGLYFVGLNGNIARQFEFIQNAWLMSATFEGLDREHDPLVGHRAGPPGPCDTYTIPNRGGASRRLYGIPQFVTVRAGAYFFLPGIRALKYLATVGTRS